MTESSRKVGTVAAPANMLRCFNGKANKQALLTNIYHLAIIM
jgi:hypothetical protein